MIREAERSVSSRDLMIGPILSFLRFERLQYILLNEHLLITNDMYSTSVPQFRMLPFAEPIPITYYRVQYIFARTVQSTMHISIPSSIQDQ